MLKLPSLLQLRPGGAADNTAITAMGLGLLATSVGSPLAGTAGVALGSLLAAGGAAHFGRKLGLAFDVEAFEQKDSALRINSSPVPDVRGEAVNLGYLVDTGEPLNIPLADFSRHMMVTGMTGVGKTILGNWLFWQQIQRGAGMLFVDGKIDGDNLLMMMQMCAAAGREHDLLVINPDDPILSNTYNPFLHGDPDEIGARVMALTPSTENNAGADYYRESASGAIRAIVAGLKASGRAYSPLDIALMLSGNEIWTAVEKMMPPGADETQQFRMWSHKFAAIDREGRDRGLDTAKIRNELGGLVNKIHTFGSGNFGKICNSYDPEVVILDAIRQNKIIYFALPTLGKKEAAERMGKLVIGDIRSALGYLQKHKKERPAKPFLCFFDEAGSYLTRAASTMLEQARSCNVCLALAVQTKGNYDYIGDDFRQAVTGNTIVKAWFKLNEPETMKWAEEMIGREKQIELSVSASRSEGLSSASSIRAKASGKSAGTAEGYTETLKEQARVADYQFLKLGKGECIIQYDGDKVYHVRVPLISFSDEFKREVGDRFTPNRRRLRRVPGVYAWRIAKEMLEKKDQAKRERGEE